MWMQLEVTEDGSPMLSALWGTPTLEQMQQVVGGLICSAWSTPSGEYGIVLDGYVNDEGLLIGLPLATRLEIGDRYETMLAGNMVIVATDRRNGETIPMTPAMVARVHQMGTLHSHGFHLRLP